LWTAPGLDINNPYLPLQPAYGVFYWICMLDIGVLVVWGSWLILEQVIRRHNFRRWESWTLILAAVIPLSSAFLEVTGILRVTGLSIGITPFFSGIGVIILLWSLPRFHLGKIIPVARDTVFERIGDCVIVLDAHNRVVDLNPAAERLAGYTSSEALGLQVEQLWPDWPGQSVPPQSASTVFKELTLTRDREQRAYDLYIYTVADENNHPLSRIAMLVDATGRKQAEDVTRRMAQRFQNMLAKQPYGILVVTSDNRVEFANQLFCDYMCLNDKPEGLVGLTGDQLIKKILPAYADPDSVLALIKEYVARGEAVNNYEVLMRDGRVFLLDFLPLIVDGKNTGRMWTHRDITERKQAEAALVQSEGKFRSLFENSMLGISEAEPNGRLVDANEAYVRMYGFDNIQQMRAEVPNVKQLYAHPEERKAVLDTIQLKGSLEPREVELVRRDGTKFWVLVSAQAVRDPQGTLLYHQAIHTDITERKQAETMLRESEERYQNISHITTDFVFSCTRAAGDYFVVVWIAGAVEKLTGYSPETVKQHGCWKFMVFPDDIPVFDQNTISLDPGMSSNCEFRIVNKNGALRWLNMSASVTRDEHTGLYHLFGGCRDITERKQAEQTITDEAERRRVFIEQIPVGIVVIDPKTARIIEFNTVAHQQLGYTGEEFLNLSIRDLDVVESAAETESRITGVQASGKASFETRHRTKGGEIRDVLVRAQSINVLGQNVYQCVWEDITERKRAEAENQQLREKAEMSSRLAAVGEMAAGIAHEINNPLTSVLGFSQLLAERQDMPADIKEQLRVIAEGSHRVKDIVRRMLTFARQNKPVKTSANVHELIDNTLEIRSYILRTANIEVVKNYDPHLPWVTVDPGQLQQVFLNLIVNAEFAMKKAHGKGTLVITTAKEDGHIRISFKDDGGGISQEVKAKIFNPFFTTKQVNEGTGLGLSLSHSIILEHGGTLEVENEAGQGATFIITLPITPAFQEAAAQGASSAPAPPAQVKSAHILVVDDEAAIRALVKAILVKEGHAVGDTGDATVVFDKIDSQRYDAVLMDIRMPGMSGMELYTRIIEKYPAMAGKVIFITGDTSDAQTGDFLAKNNLAYISKPFGRETLLKKVNAVL
jgi:PAS domain S-box-containing protein